jgi:hypothetical protein
MSLTYEHVLCIEASCGYVNIVQKIVDKRENVNANCENGKRSFAFVENYYEIILILCMIFNLLFILFYLYFYKS